MFKKTFAIAVVCFWTSVSFALVTLLPNPYGITSFRLENESYLPHMAHPSHSVETVNVDIHAQRILDFSDLFSNEEKALQIIAAYSQMYFMKELKQEGNQPAENLKARLEMIKSGTMAKRDNYQHWNLVAGYLQITFDRAQVQPSYFVEQTIDIPLSLLAENLNKKLFSNIFQLKPGDLLFQDLACGELCDGINSTTYGYQQTTVSHVGMVVSIDGKEPMIIEAVSAGVKLTSLDDFLLRSTDKLGHPRVMVGRGDAQVQALISVAIKHSLHDLNAPYNATFSPTGKGFYCSQLITQSFLQANHDQPIFSTHPMNFKLDHSEQFSPAWAHYFAELKQPIPQGEPGNNPGMLSRDPHIKIVYFYGQL